MDSITEPNELIYAGAKEVSDLIGISRRNLNGNRKTGWEIKLSRKIK